MRSPPSPLLYKNRGDGAKTVALASWNDEFAAPVDYR
jgi:hypothetical protein